MYTQCRWESQQCMASLPIQPPMRLAGFLTPPERRKPEKHVSERHPPLLMRQGTSQQWTDTLAGSRERSNSHKLLHPTRLSLSMSGATPQAAPGYRKLVEWYTSQVCVCELSWQCPPCGGVEGVRWLRSPPHTRASSVTGRAEPDRSRERVWDRGPTALPDMQGT